MIVDRADLAQHVREADVIVIGAGACGLYLMQRLARSGHRVLVLEGGGRASFLATDTPQAELVQIGRPHTGLRHGRAFGIGGTTAYWGGQLAEFDPDDFGPGWPVADFDMPRWYAAAYADLGMQRRPEVAHLRQELGSVQPPGEMDAIETAYTYWLDEPNFAHRFKRQIVGKGWPCIVMESRVSAIKCSGAEIVGLKIDGVQEPVDVSGKTVVLALGTVAASELMLRSSEEGPTPWSDNENVGRYFQDHLGGRVALIELLDERRFRDCFENGRVEGVRIQPKLKFREGHRGPLKLGVVGMMGFESNLSDDVANLKQVLRAILRGASLSSLTALPATILKSGRSFVPLVTTYLRSGRVRAFFDRELSLRVQAEQLPLRDSRILRQNGKTIVDWRVDGREGDEIIRFCRKVDTWLQEQGIGRLKLDPLLEAGDPAFLESLVDTYHQAGGLCMGGTAQSGVVDADARVWGAERLFVAGPAIFPTSSHANVTLTAVALAARLAAHIDGSLAR